jgi:hypothetical protein
MTGDPKTGAVTGAGALTYRPRQELRDQITTLLGTCQFPSCRQPSWRCDIDHQEPFNHRNPHHGGPTTTGNTMPMCRRHHLFKHHADWQVHIDPADFTVSWGSPTGHRYTKGGQHFGLQKIRVTTPASAVAERIENRQATAWTTAEPVPIRAGTDPRTPASTIAEAEADAPAGALPPAGHTTDAADTADRTDSPIGRRHACDCDHTTCQATSGSIEALLGDLLLRNHLSRAGLAYDPDPAAWDAGADDIPSLRYRQPRAPGDRGKATADDGEQPPPF